MYHFANHDIYHHINPYQQQVFGEHSKNTNVLGAASTVRNNFESVVLHDEVVPQCGTRSASTEPHALAIPIEKSKLVTNKNSVDTSSFSIEERLVAAVWVHERRQTKNNMSQIKKDFRQRFGRDPPAKNTLLVWERKLFSTGSVQDAPRPGRPIKRRKHMDEVSASVRAAPALSLRARARALHVPRTTLRTLLARDFPRTQQPIAAGKLQKNIVKKQISQK